MPLCCVVKYRVMSVTCSLPLEHKLMQKVQLLPFFCCITVCLDFPKRFQIVSTLKVLFYIRFLVCRRDMTGSKGCHFEMLHKCRRHSLACCFTRKSFEHFSKTCLRTLLSHQNSMYTINVHYKTTLWHGPQSDVMINPQLWLDIMFIFSVSVVYNSRSTVTPPRPRNLCRNSTQRTAWRWLHAHGQGVAWSAHDSGCLCQRTVSSSIVLSSHLSTVSITNITTKFF